MSTTCNKLTSKKLLVNQGNLQMKERSREALAMESSHFSRGTSYAKINVSFKLLDEALGNSMEH